MEKTIVEVVPSTAHDRSNEHKEKKKKKKKSCITNAESKSGTDNISSPEKSHMKGGGMTGDVNLSSAIDPQPIIPCLEAADGNQNEDKNAKKRKKPRKKKGHIINAESNNGADNISFPENSHIREDIILSPASDVRDQSVAQVSQLPRKESDKAPSIHPVREAADGNKNEGQSTKKRKRPRKKKGNIVNAESNNGADNISLPENSHIKEDIILSPASDARDHSFAEVSRLPRKESDKAPSIHPVREAADGYKNEGQSTKKRKRSKKKQSPIISLESNNSADNISLPENSHIKEDIILSPASDARDQSFAQISQLPIKESDKAPSIHPVREATDDNKSEGQSTKKRKRSKKKQSPIISPESNSGIYNISSPKKSPAKGDITLSPASDAYHHAGGAQVSQLARKESEEALIIHPDSEAANGNQNECKTNKKKRLRKRNKTTLPIAGDTDRAEGTNVDRKADESIANGLSNGVGNDTNCCDSAPSNAHVSSEQRNGGDPHRKLLILDLNGILADIRSSYGVKGFKADRYCKKTIVYKRPFVDDFLQFCFDNFDVGIWTSRKSTAMHFAVGALMKGERFLFCLDQSYCTKTGLNAIGCKNKPLFLKELKKLWNGELGIQKYIGGYNESNTLLVDDSPYKAVRNPPHTAIFPRPYVVTDTKDKSLGPNGELRLYLARLAKAENVQVFVRENPIGQLSIKESDKHWDFYSKIIKSEYPIPNNLVLSDPCTSPPPVQGPRLGCEASIMAKKEEKMELKRIIGPLTLSETEEIESRKEINALKDMIGPLTLSQTKEMAAWQKRNAPKHRKEVPKQQKGKNKQDVVKSASNNSHGKIEHPSEIGETAT